MNYALKLHSPTSVFGPFRAQLKCCQERFYFCGYCNRRHVLSRANARELSDYSSYLLMLKMMLKKRQTMKLNTREDYNFVGNVNPDIKAIQKRKEKSKYTELVKVSNFKSTETTMNVEKIKASDVKAFAEKSGMTFGMLNPGEKTIKARLNNKPVTEPLLNSSPSSRLNRNPKGNKKNALNQFNGFVKSKTLAHAYNVKLNSAFKEIGGHLKESSGVKNSSDSNAKTDVLKILPPSALKIVPLPKNKAISKKSVKSLKKLSPSGTFSNPEFKNNQNQTILTGAEENVNEKLNSDLREKPSVIDIEEKFWEDQTRDKPYRLKTLLDCQLDICTSSNMLNEGLNLLNVYRKRSNWKEVKDQIDFVSTYNILLKAYSMQGDWTTVCNLTNWMNEDGVVFNCETYAILLDCLGRVDKGIFKIEDHWKEEIVKILQSIYKKEILLNNIFTKSSLTKNQSENILKTIRVVLPCFEVAPTKIKLNSNCPLLADLYRGPKNIESPIGDELTLETLEQLVDEQLQIEKHFDIQVKSVSNPTGATVDENQKKRFENLLEEWRNAMLKEFINDLKYIERSYLTTPSKFSLYFYMKTLPPEMFVDVMIQMARNLLEYSGNYSPGTYILHRILGEKIHLRYQTRKVIENENFGKLKDIFKSYCRWVLHPSGPAMNGRQELQMLLQDSGNAFLANSAEFKWPDIIKLKLGKQLFDIIVRSTKINTAMDTDGRGRRIPAFYLILRSKNKKLIEEIKCHPVVAKFFQKVGFQDLIFSCDQVPMLCPPLPWRSTRRGGFLLLPTEFIRRPRDEGGQRTDLRGISYQQLYATFDSLNVLQSVPWIVNEKVLDVALEVFKNGGSEELSVPSYPDVTPLPAIDAASMSQQQYREEANRRQQILQKRRNLYSLWCEALYRLSLANHFRGRIFWLPQNFDFRGRVYPVPPLLNHLGSDFFRALLLFAKGKPLGPRGLDWIKIHTINLTGTHKKRPLKERLEHANNILDEMIDSAERPLTGDKWWAKSEEPWQTLAACMELRNAVMSPNPEKHISRFPIHQDGSCNGLQHYAALGRDLIGAKSVNLAPSEMPQDVYSSVVDILEKKRIEDADMGVEIATILEGFVKRKVVKQTIMTTVYGVTNYGARLQIAGQLEDIREFPDECVWWAAGYLTKKTFESLQQMFTSAKEIQEWFIRCAQIITKKRDYVKWVSPLGLPVLQPYSKKKNEKTDRAPNSMKQQNAFPPNFIHSLDSCHMMMTALNCEQAGLTFASIHDCFWTHPCNVDIMNKICRDQFILLHSHPILEDLSKFFHKVYITGENAKLNAEAEKIFKSIPKTGDFDLNSIRDSVYFFS